MKRQNFGQKYFQNAKYISARRNGNALKALSREFQLKSLHGAERSVLKIRESLLKTLNTYNVHTLGVFRRRRNAIIRDPSTEITSSEPARKFIYASAPSSFANEFNLNINYSLRTKLPSARYYYA